MPKFAVQRAVDQFRQGGAAAFFLRPKPRVGNKLTSPLRAQAQTLLQLGQTVSQITPATGGLANAL